MFNLTAENILWWHLQLQDRDFIVCRTLYLQSTIQINLTGYFIRVVPEVLDQDYSLILLVPVQTHYNIALI